MTDLLEKAVATARALPPEVQDEIARMVLTYACDSGSTIQLTPEEDAEQDAADDEEARGAYATDDEMTAVWAKHGL